MELIKSPYNFTRGVQRALVIARRTAVEYQHGSVRPEHIVVALLEAGQDGDMKRLAKAASVDRLRLAEQIRAELEPGSDGTAPGEALPYEDSARTALADALTMAQRNGHEWTGTDHLFVASIDRLGRQLGPMRAELEPLMSQVRAQKEPWWKVWR